MRPKTPKTAVSIIAFLLVVFSFAACATSSPAASGKASSAGDDSAAFVGTWKINVLETGEIAFIFEFNAGGTGHSDLYLNGELQKEHSGNFSYSAENPKLTYRDAGGAFVMEYSMTPEGTKMVLKNFLGTGKDVTCVRTESKTAGITDAALLGTWEIDVYQNGSSIALFTFRADGKMRLELYEKSRLLTPPTGDYEYRVNDSKVYYGLGGGGDFETLFTEYSVTPDGKGLMVKDFFGNGFDVIGVKK